MLNVQDFGAKGDGIVGDTIAIQAAINSGNEIFIPYGTYLISSNLTLKSDIIITGYGTLKANADGLNMFTSGTAGIQNIQIIGITIDGGGQVGGVVDSGFKGVIGIYLTNCSNIIIDKVYIKNCGVINPTDPYTDAGFGGFGIYIECRYGQTTNIKIINCTIEYIAGGGMNAGDGIVVSGYNSNLAIVPEDVLVSNCSINIVGRNGISLAGGESTSSLAKNIRVANNYISNTQLSGLDIEDGSDIILAENEFYKCGNISVYYNYGSKYPTTYRLRTAIATGETSNDITISDSIIKSCNNGITYGVMLNKITNVFISDSDTTDIIQGLANAGDLTITDCQFTSNKDCFNYYSTSQNNVKINNCLFEGTVKIITLQKGNFSNCTFKNGFVFTNPDSENIIWDNCDFSGTGTGTGIGINVSGGPYFQITNCMVVNCNFNNLSTGITSDYENIIGWQIIDCFFANITGYGIRHTNSGGVVSFKRISGNKFINNLTATGEAISIVQSNPRINIFQNYFEFFATCISITNIVYGTDLLDAIVGDNLAISCTNGIVIANSTGNWDRCIVIYNNMFGCSGTKISLITGGNANGIVGNNII